MRENAPSGATVVTDQHAGYVGLDALGYAHIRINHSVGEYVREMAHTNGIESFWALLKRGHYGIFHYMSAKHLHRYVAEFDFRYCNREGNGCDDAERSRQALKGIAGKRLTYNPADAKGLTLS